MAGQGAPARLTVTLAAGRSTCLDSITGFLRAVDGIDEYQLLGASRCHGWSRMDVVTHDVAASLASGVDGLSDGCCRWQGQVFSAGDYLAVWAVENVVHHLDLVAAEPAPVGALALARATVEALVGAPLPPGWSDEEAVLVGTGRRPVPDGSGGLASRLPALG